jgi:hypothetical protein
MNKSNQNIDSWVEGHTTYAAVSYPVVWTAFGYDYLQMK